MKLLDRISSLGLNLAVVCGIALAVFVFLSAAMRYLLGAPFRFTEELVGILFVSSIFLTLPACNAFDRHITIDLFRKPKRQAVKTIKQLFLEFAIISFYCIFGYQAYEFAALSYILGSRSEMGGILLYPWMAIMPLVCGLAVFIRLQKVARLFAPGSAQAKLKSLTLGGS